MHTLQYQRCASDAQHIAMHHGPYCECRQFTLVQWALLLDLDTSHSSQIKLPFEDAEVYHEMLEKVHIYLAVLLAQLIDYLNKTL